MFGFGDARKSYLKSSESVYASRAIELYSSKETLAYKMFLANTGNADCWRSYKTWLTSSFSPAEAPVSDEQLFNLYLIWFEAEWWEQDESVKSRIQAMWLADSYHLFDSKDKDSGQFFEFAAFLEMQYQSRGTSLTTENTYEPLEVDEIESNEFLIEVFPENIDPTSTNKEELLKLRNLFEESLIDEDEYKALKKKLLGL